MGKSKWRRRNNDKNGAGGNDETKKSDGYDIIIKKNELFEKYYKQLDLIEPSDFEKFLDTLKQPLPITFRITSYKSYAKEILKILKEKHFAYIDDVTKTNKDQVVEASANKGASLIIAKYGNKDGSGLNSQEIGCNADEEIYKCLPWYPNELGWQVNLSRQDVRKNVHFEQFKQFLINQTENGNLNRQEAVSMIPPLLLDIKSHHKILDMCASPGSKTAQLIEFLHNDTTEPVPEGFVIANDLDNKRCYMLMHQLKRLESPNFMIINQDASSLPNFRCDDPNQTIAYDRILADVPCSGDGTFRKNIDVWTKWNFAHACNLHGIQSRIAKRAAELLQYEGLMVYSTCSLNPLENEAVVYNLLLKFKDQLELVDVRHKLTGMKTSKGMIKWNVMGKNGEIFETSEQVAKTEFACLIRPYMFPPEESVAKELNIDRCIRILPHQQNTGGFFIAVIRKLPLVKQCDLDSNYLSATTASSVGENTNEKSKDSSKPPEADTSRAMKAPPAKRLKHVWLENPFQFMETNEDLARDWIKIKEFYGISDDFPVNQMMTRNRKGENIRNIYIVSKQIKELTINNGDRFKFINMGVSLFARADIKDPTTVEYRISQEGVDIIVKYLTKRIVMITERSDLIKILTESNPLIVQLSQGLQQQINQQCSGVCGSFILRFEIEKNDSPITFVSWLGKSSVRPLMNIQTRGFFLTVIGVEQSTINEACEKIKQEDKINSAKSLITNPHYKPKANETEKMDEQEIQANEDENSESEEDEATKTNE